MSLTFIDFFAGVGGFRRGMELAGHKCVGFCEFDKFAVMSYTIMHLATPEQRGLIASIPAPPKKNGERNLNARQKEILKEEYRNGEWYANDITTVDAGSMPDADMWCFGAPCQDFSLAGNRAGLDGDRSSLVREVFRLVKERPEGHRPKYLVYENVKGMLSSNRGWDFACILVEMETLGYDIEYQLLNSKDFGVPQNRERVFVIGHLRGGSGGKVFPISGTTGENSEDLILYGCKNGVNSQANRIYSVAGNAPTLRKPSGGSSEPTVAIPSFCDLGYGGGLVTTNEARCLQSRYYKGVCGRAAETSGVVTLGNVNPSGNGMNGNVYDSSGLCPTLTTNKGEGNKVAVSGLYTGVSKAFRRPPLPGLSRCLKSDKHDAGVTDGIRIRRLTPKECFRLQAWEDMYYYRAELVNSDSQLYKQAGNGVTVSVIEAIGRKLEVCVLQGEEGIKNG